MAKDTEALTGRPEITAIAGKLGQLREEAQALVVTDQNQYTQALAFVKSLRGYKKDVGFKLDPGIASAKNHVEFLREEKAKYIRPVDELDKLVSGKASVWREQERKAAEAEQARINEERRRIAAAEAEVQRKAAEKEAARQQKERQKQIEQAQKSGELKKREAARLQKESARQAEEAKEQARKDAEAAAQVKEVKVAPSIPKISGIKGRTNWKFRWQEDGENELLDGFRENMSLRRFVQANEQQIGSMVRGKKDKAKAEAECPGIEVFSEDSV